jgi:KTSC domain
MTARRVCLESSALTAVSFSPETNVLEVEFRNGLTYEYLGVPYPLYEQLLSASSKGAFLGRFIRNAFPFRRVAGKPPNHPLSDRHCG